MNPPCEVDFQARTHALAGKVQGRSFVLTFLWLSIYSVLIEAMLLELHVQNVQRALNCERANLG